MEFVPRTQPSRTNVYRRPSVDVRPRVSPAQSMADVKPIPAPAVEYEIPEVKHPPQQARPINSDIGVYHDIIPQRSKQTQKAGPEPVGPQSKISESDDRNGENAHPGKDPEATLEQTVVAAAIEQNPKKRKGYRLLYVAAASIFLLGGSVVLQGFLTNKDAETQVRALQTQAGDGESSGLPTDEKPKDKNYVANHKVSPLLPRVLSISSIGVSARVTQVGTDKEGAMLAPSTAYDAGWYTGSSRPGENGAMVIDGHVRGVGGPGVFDKLNKLKAGDEITVERGDGNKYTYAVTGTETVSTKDVDMGKLLVSSDTAVPGLNLITCAGTYDAKNNQFDKRTVVYAVQK